MAKTKQPARTKKETARSTKKARLSWPSRWDNMTPFSLYWAARERLFGGPRFWQPEEARELARRAGEAGYEAGTYLYRVLTNLPDDLHWLFDDFARDAAQGSPWGLFFSGLCCKVCHTHGAVDVSEGCPSLLLAAKCGNLEAQAELRNTEWIQVAAKRMHPVALFLEKRVEESAQAGYYEAIRFLAQPKPVTEGGRVVMVHDCARMLTLAAKAVAQYDLSPTMDAWLVSMAQDQLQLFRRSSIGLEADRTLSAIAFVSHTIRPWVDVLPGFGSSADLVIQRYDTWCFRARRTTLYWMHIYRFGISGFILPKDVAKMIGRYVWNSRLHPACGWERPNMW